MADETRNTAQGVSLNDNGLPGPSQAELDAVLDDPTMSREEKLARLEELRETVVHRDDEEYAPLSTRIMDALSMLAQGGHDYGDTPLDDEPKT